MSPPFRNSLLLQTAAAIPIFWPALPMRHSVLCFFHLADTIDLQCN
jgi:hypothetical protein